MERINFKRRSLVYVAAALATVILASSSASADISVPVTHGWDWKEDPKATGKVIYNVIRDPRSRGPKLRITYKLENAKPLQKYELAIGLFELPGDGLSFFGVKRFLRENHTREQVNATVDGFIVGSFRTDRFGNGQSHVDLNLAGVPPGTYNAQFTWTRLSDLRAYYRTGAKYGADFAKIVVPKQ